MLCKIMMTSCLCLNWSVNRQSFIFSSISRETSRRYTRRDDKRLDDKWMIARMLDTFVELYTFLFFDRKAIFALIAKSLIREDMSRQVFKKQVLILLFKRQSSHWYDEFWRWLENAWSSIEESKKNILKNREIDVKRDLQNCMYEIRIDFDKKKASNEDQSRVLKVDCQLQ